MNLRYIVGILGFCLCTVGVSLVNTYIGKMIAAINQTKSKDEKISDLGFTYPKIMKIFREYSEIYPNGKLTRSSHVALALAIAGFLCLVFFLFDVN